MVERVHLSDSNKATFICPKCKTTKTVDASKYAHVSKTVKIKSSCSCGYSWTSVLEKRKQYRKSVNLPGTYELIREGTVVDRGSMKISDISGGGVKMKLNVKRDLEVGDFMTIEFHLDDSKRTFIRKDVEVRNVSDVFVGTKFRFVDAYDPVLGFYLMT
jgi:hypothetical protein